MTRRWDMYKRQPGFVLGFHGCDQRVGESVLAGERHLTPSTNPYDWLGSGIYFWESSPARALQFAEAAASTAKMTTKGNIKTPFVLGAIIDLGNCFNLIDASALKELREAYDFVSSALAATELPKNVGGPDKLMRNLDRAVLETMHQLRAGFHEASRATPPYDTVRSPFGEGGELYPGSGFSSKAHIQIAVRNSDCIRGYFRPIQR